MKTYKKIELVGTSDRSFEDAIDSAIRQAERSVKGMSWFEVSEFRGAIKDGKASEYQVTLKVGFRVLEED